ncbi:MAG: GHKL domain-containing protein [Flavobacteriales bacterium]|nr:GHKL domain-containing protein [Flavobacteriales bacterium]
MCALLLGATLSAQADDAVFELRPDEERPYLGSYLSVLSTNVDTLDPDLVLGSVGFNVLEDAVPNLGLSANTHFVKFSFVNWTSTDELVLTIGHADIDNVEVYRIVGGTTTTLIGRSGLRVPPALRHQQGKEHSFALWAVPNTRHDLLIKLQSTKQLQLPIRVQPLSELARSRSTRNIFLGGYIGIMLVMVLYNLFIFLSMRDKSYLLYVLYIVAVALTQLAFTGIAPAYLWHGATWFAPKATVLLTIATAILASEFIIDFIRTAEHSPRIQKGLRLFYIPLGICVLMDLTGMELMAYKATQVIAGVFASYMIVSVLKIWRSGSRQAGYFLAAWSVFLVGTVLFVMKDMGLLPYTDLTIYTMPVGSAVEGVLLSFGLADRINILRRDKERSQAESLRISLENERIIREQNVILDQKVKERTFELEQSNRDLKRTQSQLVDAEKMASLGQLTAGIAHEINNPINFITSNLPPLRRNLTDVVDLLREYRTLDPPVDPHVLLAIAKRDEELGIEESITELDAILDSIHEGADRTAEIVRGLRNFSRLDEDDLKVADINEGLRSTLTVLGPQIRDQIQLELRLGDIPQVECYPGKVNQVFMNIITNALQAATERAKGPMPAVTVSSSVRNGMVQVTISDNGPGIPEENLTRIFEPFFTTKDVGQGTGLGLSIAYSIIEKHHGSIHVESTVGVGTSFVISIPVQHEGSEQKRA